VRGEEWISSTPKHVILYHYLGWEKEMPLFYHTPLLRNPDKSKLSKRHGHTDVTWFMEEGFLPEAILNFLAHLGWTHPQAKELFSLDEFITLFDLNAIRSVGPIFDLTKLTWMNGVYLREMSVSQLMSRLQSYYASQSESVIDLSVFSEEKLQQIVTLTQSRIDTLKAFAPLVAHFLSQATFYATTEADKAIARSLHDALSLIKVWNIETILVALRGVLQKHSIRMPVLYTIVTGQERGLPLPESLEILGKEITLSRLKVLLS
jgi:glutamyl-tRNA synthetase